MTAITRDDLRQALKRGEVGPLYLLYGSEDYLRDRASRAICNLALKDAAMREFNESYFNLSSDSIRDALGVAEQLPMMAERRVVRISSAGKLNEQEESALMSYIERPSESTVLIFEFGDIDKRRKYTKPLMERCLTVEFTPLPDGELVVWCRSHLKELKAEADDNTIRFIVSVVGNSVRTLSNELDKLATAALGTGRITIELVEDLVGRSRELSNFELLDHLVSRNRPKALATLQKILDDGAEPLALVGLIASNFRKLALAKDLMSRGAPEQEVFRLTGPMFGNRRRDFLATARRANFESLASRIRQIADADLAIKTSKGTPRLQVEILVFDLTS